MKEHRRGKDEFKEQRRRRSGFKRGRKFHKGRSKQKWHSITHNMKYVTTTEDEQEEKRAGEEEIEKDNTEGMRKLDDDSHMEDTDFITPGSSRSREKRKRADAHSGIRDSERSKDRYLRGRTIRWKVIK
ncbi:hypothetical protein FXO37_18148 [Capsicum annuum]|nr:hypothetical protein FXO37_18148 [Capsicum annuum]